MQKALYMLIVKFFKDSPHARGSKDYTI